MKTAEQRKKRRSSGVEDHFALMQPKVIQEGCNNNLHHERFETATKDAYIKLLPFFSPSVVKQRQWSLNHFHIHANFLFFFWSDIRKQQNPGVNKRNEKQTKKKKEGGT